MVWTWGMLLVAAAHVLTASAPVEAAESVTPAPPATPAGAAKLDGDTAKRDSFSAVLKARLPEVQACADSTLTVPLAQRHTLKLTAEVSDGAVRDVQVEDSKVEDGHVPLDADFVACVVAAVKTWAWEDPDKTPKVPLQWGINTAGKVSLVYAGGLTRGEIQTVFNEAMDRIKSCYERELNKNDDLAGTLNVTLVIEGDGGVTDVNSTLRQGALGDTGACVEGVVGALVFPKPEGGGNVFVSYPFVFSASPRKTPPTLTAPAKPAPPPKRTKVQRPPEPRLSPGLCTDAWDKLFGPSASTLPEQPLTTSPSPKTLRF